MNNRREQLPLNRFWSALACQRFAGRPEQQSASNSSPTRSRCRLRQLAHSKAAGFTLIELMAVVLIMIILVTIGIMALPKMSKALAVDRGAHLVLNLYEHARQIAITRRVQTIVTLNNYDNGGGYAHALSIAVKNKNFGPHLFTNSLIDTNRDETYLVVQDAVMLPLNCQIVFPFNKANYATPKAWPWTICPATINQFLAQSVSIYNGFSNVTVRSKTPMSRSPGPDTLYYMSFDKYGKAEMTSTTVVAEVTMTGGIDRNTPNKLGIVTEKGTGRIYITRDVPLDISSWF